MNLMIFGPPGSGKGTYASRLAPMLNIMKISTGDIFRAMSKEDSPLGQKIAGILGRGELVPDEVTNEVFKETISRQNVSGFIFDGYPRTIDQAKFLDSFLKTDAIIKINVSKEIIVARLSARRFCSKCGEIFNILFLKPKADGVCDKCGGNLIQRSDDKSEVISERFDVYEKQSAPVLDYYEQEGTVPFVEITTPSVNTPPEEMIEKIMAGLKKINLIK